MRTEALDFEWDEAKRLTNFQKHGLDFKRVPELLDGRHVVSAATRKIEEVRWLFTGLADDRYMTVVCTLRGETIRIISLRSARNVERRRYQALYG